MSSVFTQLTVRQCDKSTSKRTVGNAIKFFVLRRCIQQEIVVWMLRYPFGTQCKEETEETKF